MGERARPSTDSLGAQMRRELRSHLKANQLRRVAAFGKELKRPTFLAEVDEQDVIPGNDYSSIVHQHHAIHARCSLSNG